MLNSSENPLKSSHEDSSQIFSKSMNSNILPDLSNYFLSTFFPDCLDSNYICKETFRFTNFGLKDD